MNGALVSGYLPLIQSGATIAVGLDQAKIPFGVQGVDFDLVVLMVVAIRVDKYLKVVILKDDAIVFGEGCPDMRLFEIRSDVEVVVIPEQFRSGSISGMGFRVSFDIDKGIGSGSVLPEGLVQFAVER